MEIDFYDYAATPRRKEKWRTLDVELSPEMREFIEREMVLSGETWDTVMQRLLRSGLEAIERVDPTPLQENVRRFPSM